MSLRALLATLPRRPIYLHVDINRTIIQTDTVDGKSVEQVLSANVSAASYGTVDKATKEWSLVHGPEEAQRSDDLYSYSDYVDEILYAHPTFDASATSEAKVLAMKALRKQRQQKYYSFPEPGGPGEQFRWAVDKQQQFLTRPSGAGQWHIIPSFFRLVNELSEADYPFVLYFRTFGTDLPSVLAEWKQFVFGELEYKPSGPVLAKMREAWVEPSVGAIYREGGGMFLTWGVSRSAPMAPSGHEGGLAYLHSLDLYKSAFKVEDTALFPEMAAEAAKANNVAGFIDYFMHWSSNGERAFAGKLMPTDTRNYHVFFDDNIFLFDVDENSIVDFRHEDGTHMPDEEAQQYAVKVEPYFAIVEEDYFTRHLAARLETQAATRVPNA